MKRGVKQPNIIKRQKRNKNVVAYHEAHLGVSVRVIARIWHLSHTMVGDILRKDKEVIE